MFYLLVNKLFLVTRVTLRVRVWIETLRYCSAADVFVVTLRVRVWIETVACGY